MNILTIDTASKIELIAVSAHNNISYTAKKNDYSHSITIFDNIDMLLKKSGLTIKEINLIGVGIGPGSFTGIRIAVSTARILAQLLKAPLVGIKTHLIYCSSIEANENNNILIANDARKGRVFGALYIKSNNPLSPVEIVEPGDYPIDHLLDRVDINNKATLVGNGIEKYMDIISEKLTDYKYLPEFLPSGEIACKLIYQLYKKNPEQYLDYSKVIPFYARKSDAELLKKK